METWQIWLALAGLVVILELMTGTFYLLMIAIGLCAGALLAFLHATFSWQMLVAAIVGAGTTSLLHRSRFGLSARRNAARDPNIHIDIGQTLQVDEWQARGDGLFVARVKYRGAMWDVELRQAQAHSGQFLISEMNGSRLIVQAV